jgi:hypothetical protein
MNLHVNSLITVNILRYNLCMMTQNTLICTYLLEKSNKIIHFSVRNACMEHRFDNFTCEYYLKGELSIFCSSFEID